MFLPRKPWVVTTLVTGYMVTGWILTQTDQYYILGMGLNLLAPVPLAWMVFTVLKNGNYSGRELDANEEFGYQDKDRNSLGTW